MDCKQRIAFLLFGALILCAANSTRLIAQDGRITAYPESNAPRTVAAGSQQTSASSGGSNHQVRSEESLDRPAQPFVSFGTGNSADSSQAATSSDRPLTPLKRTANSSLTDNDAGTSGTQTGSSSAGTVLAALVVLLLFLLGLAKLFLKRSPYSISGLPVDAVDVLGRRAVDPRNSVYMVKVGSRLMLLGSSPNGLSSLAEITDPIEVASLSNICNAARQTGPDAAKWLSKLWPGSKTIVESRPFDDQLGEKLFEEAQRDESGRVDSLTIATSREQHRAG